MEVRSISAGNSTVVIMNPVFLSNCNGKTNKPVIDLKLSPFVYSQYNNKFAALGCGKLSSLKSNGSTVAGCVSICDDNITVYNTSLSKCNGRYCCQTSLPSYLSEYNATLAGNPNQTTHECSYAFIASDDWLQSNYIYYMDGERSSELKSVDYVPGVLEWEIINEMLSNSTHLKLPSDSVNSYCYHSNVTSSSQNKTSGLTCVCSVGFYGESPP